MNLSFVLSHCISAISTCAVGDRIVPGTVGLASLFTVSSSLVFGSPALQGGRTQHAPAPTGATLFSLFAVSTLVDNPLSLPRELSYPPDPNPLLLAQTPRTGHFVILQAFTYPKFGTALLYLAGCVPHRSRPWLGFLGAQITIIGSPHAHSPYFLPYSSRPICCHISPRSIKRPRRPSQVVDSATEM
ncbi:hypothetical protein BJV78DRAFT_584464 [Lactifluus subvellereus]|nr:hypothetical protein BJV78DRAFT_584464 [Lactifluus subvellereus]